MEEYVPSILFQNFAVSENPAICRNCTDLAWRAFTFKSKCISTEEIILSYAVVKKVASLDMKWIYNTKIACEVTENDYVPKQVGTVSSRNISDAFVLEEFDIIRPVVCVPCVDLLTNYFKFAFTSASVEEIINEYCQQEGTNSNGFVNFDDVVNFSRGEGARCAVTFNESVVEETLSSDDDSDFKEVDIKIEEHDVKDEVENGEFRQDLVYKNASEVTMYKCCKCEFNTKHKWDLKRHSLVHENASEMTMYKCCKCEFKTKHQTSLKRHSLVHKKDSEVTSYKCCRCKFKTKHQCSFKNHSLVHKKTSEVTMYKCCKCEFKTKHKTSLRNHRLVHKKASEVTMYKCCKCEFKTKHQRNLSSHSLVHKDASEVTMYKCCKMRI
ncbi:hypothetical protein NQ317_017733 [Molorchus minor]|uniref:C2H2-type domain-containing protein n=1 Tax=Molorchus minor TaxID=1323400 RepID=A0ABQ9IX67_9CUCU|nr:hypothetical protein NQ317_017733 [Molorchus minor]